MPDYRYLLKNNDPTSTGGFLMATRHNFTHHGVPVGLEGDVATCPACKSAGPVFNDCHPNWDVDGRQVLVSGARVHCKCPVKPFVYNTQIDSTVEVSRLARGHGPSAVTYFPSDVAGAEGGEIVEQYYEITDGDGRPIEGYRCDVFVGGECAVKNTEMRGGRTIVVHGQRGIDYIVMWLDKRGQECV